MHRSNLAPDVTQNSWVESLSPPVARGHALVDANIAARLSAAEKSGYRSSCGSGCSHCCYEPMYAEKQEARFLVETLTADGADMEVIRQRTQAWWDGFFSAGMHLRTTHTPGDFATLFRYRGARLACPVLADGICTAYAARPIGCRTHIAFGPRSACATERKRARQQFLLIPPELMSWALGEMCENAPCALFEFDHLGIWLGHLLLGKSERSAIGHTAVVTQSAPLQPALAET